jgi:hypothetical protein
MIQQDPLKPSLTLLSKLGSLTVHFEEMLSLQGHPFDTIAAEQLLRDPEIIQWVRAMGPYLPVKR